MLAHHSIFVFLRNYVLLNRILIPRRVKESSIQCYYIKYYSSNNKNNNMKSVVIERTISLEDVKAFSALAKDFNSIHTINNNKKAIIHGAFLNAIVSGVIGTKLPGNGTIVVSQTLKFPKPCFAGDTVTVTVEMKDIRKIISCSYIVVNKLDGSVVLEGSAQLMLRKVTGFSI